MIIHDIYQRPGRCWKPGMSKSYFSTLSAGLKDEFIEQAEPGAKHPLPKGLPAAVQEAFTVRCMQIWVVPWKRLFSPHADTYFKIGVFREDRVLFYSKSFHRNLSRAKYKEVSGNENSNKD